MRSAAPARGALVEQESAVFERRNEHLVGRQETTIRAIANRAIVDLN